MQAGLCRCRRIEKHDFALNRIDAENIGHIDDITSSDHNEGRLLVSELAADDGDEYIYNLIFGDE